MNASNCTFTNNLIANNQANFKGAGFLNYTSNVTLINNTITNNHCIVSDPYYAVGAGLCDILDGTSTGKNNIIYDNYSTTSPNVYGSPTLTYTCVGIQTLPGLGNINADPLFAAGPGGAYYLAQIAAGQPTNSPCLDAGDPAASMITGTTRTDQVQDAGVVDMGYHYGLAAVPADLNVTLAPINPPISIPAAGGSFSFTATVQRVSGTQAPFYVWSRDRFPDGSYTANLLGPVLINPPVGQQVTRIRQQNVPGSWPTGTHRYIGYANPTVAYPATDADSFAWTKLTTGTDSPWISEATCTGESFPGEEIPPLSRGDRGDLVAISPNPFNPTTALSYKLQAASQVSLRVYDISGRLVTTLVDGMQEAGSHEATFDGSKLASGMYFAKMEAGSYTAVQKLVLMK